MKYKNLIDAAMEHQLREKQTRLGEIAAKQQEIVTYLRSHPLASTIAGPIIESLCSSQKWLNGFHQPEDVTHALNLLTMSGRSEDTKAIMNFRCVPPLEDCFLSIRQLRYRAEENESKLRDVAAIADTLKRLAGQAGS